MYYFETVEKSTLELLKKLMGYIIFNVPLKLTGGQEFNWDGIEKRILEMTNAPDKIFEQPWTAFLNSWKYLWKTTEKKIRMNLTNLKTGMYFIKAVNKGEQFNRKIVLKQMYHEYFLTGLVGVIFIFPPDF